MNEYLYFIVLIVVFILAFLVGCSPVIPVEPIISISIEPKYSEIGLNESVELRCVDQLVRPVMASWSKRCSAGTLSTDIGESCTYTTPKTMPGIQEIYAEYEGLKAIAKVKGMK